MFNTKSSRNEDCATYLIKESKPHWEWVITVYFYSALHLAKGFLIKKCGKNFADIENHRDISNFLLDAARNSLIRPEVRKSYMKLFWASKIARYDYSPYSKYVNEVLKFDDSAYITKVNNLIANDFSKIKSNLSPII